MKKAVIYARVSSTSDRQNCERQVSDLTKYAEANNMDVANVYEEHISGAKRNEERPVLNECLDYCLSNSVDVLLLSELSRLGRNVWEITENVKRCKDEHLNLYFQKEGFTLFTPDGNESACSAIMIAVLGTCAQIERENITYRLQSGYKNFREKGGKVGRKEGYSKSKEKMMQEYANVVKELKRGTSIRRTAKLTDVSPATVQKVKRELL